MVDEKQNTIKDRFVDSVIALISFIVALLLIVLLVSNFKSHEKLRQSAKDLYGQSVRDKASQISKFIFESSAQLEMIARGRDLAIYYENKALGMSMEYGLKASITAIENEFKELIASNDVQHMRTAPYARLIYVDTNGTCLVDVCADQSAKNIPYVPDGGTGAAIQQKVSLHVLFQGESEYILIQVPFYFKGTYSGLIVGWISLHMLDRQVQMTQKSNSVDALFFVQGGAYASFASEQDSYCLLHHHYNVRSVLNQSVIGNIVTYRPEKGTGCRSRFLISRVNIKGTIIDVVSVAEESIIVGKARMGMYIFSLSLVLGYVILTIVVYKRFNERNMLLRAHIVHQEQRSHEIEQLVEERTQALHASNQQLQEGILQREKAKEESLRLAKELHRAQKLESIGTLAAGVAHEINTPIQFIGDNTRFVAESTSALIKLLELYRSAIRKCSQGKLSDEAQREILEAEKGIDTSFLEKEIPEATQQTLDGVIRVSKIVSAMKEFSHMGTDKKAPEDINKAVESTVVISKNEWKYKAAMVTQYDKDMPRVPCIIGDIKQVVLNLIINAVHTIEDACHARKEDKGTIVIKTFLRNQHAVISVTDTGMGIPDDVREKIFDPFFTTKEVGKGTGQGLSMAYASIVEKHKGKLTFVTEVGKGTTFEILLPLTI